MSGGTLARASWTLNYACLFQEFLSKNFNKNLEPLKEFLDDRGLHLIIKYEIVGLI